MFQEEASPQPNRPQDRCRVTSGDLGTHGMHPLRKRAHIYSESGTIAKNPAVTFSCSGGHSGPPLRGGFVSRRGITTAEAKRCRNLRDIRRPRHAWDASTAQAGHTFTASHPLPLIIQLSRFHVRADTAVRPYAEDLFQEEASPQPKRPQDRRFVTPSDLGTHGMYPPRKRAPHYVDTHCIHEDHNRAVYGQAPWPARTHLS